MARAARQFPGMLPMLGDGRLTLCTAADLAPLLNSENADDLLGAAAGKSRREVQALAFAAGKVAPVRDVIRRVGMAKESKMGC